MGMMSKIRSLRLRQGKAISEIARLTSLSRNTIKKWLKAPQRAQPKYRWRLCRRGWCHSPGRCSKR
jgi:transcriptional regulator with XRE-family HTH domain